jgi:hypothetical protein
MCLLSTTFERLPEDCNFDITLQKLYNKTNRWVDNWNEVFYHWLTHHKQMSDKHVILLGFFRTCISNARVVYNAYLNRDDHVEIIEQFLQHLLKEMLEQFN